MLDVNLFSIVLGAFLGAFFTVAMTSLLRYINRPRIDFKLVITGINNVDLDEGLPLDMGGIFKVKIINRGRRSIRNLTISIRSMSKFGMVSIKIGSLHPNHVMSYYVGRFEGDKIVLSRNFSAMEEGPFNSGIIIDTLPDVLELTASENDMPGIRHNYYIRTDLIIEDWLDTEIDICDSRGKFYGSIPVSEHHEPKYVRVMEEKEIKKYYCQMKKKKIDDW